MAQLSTKAHWVAGVAISVAACAGGNPKPMAPPLYGVWSDARTNNRWVEIDATHLMAFGVTQDGRCTATRADAATRNHVVLPVSPIGVGPMSLSVDGGALVVAGKNATQRFVRSSREAICRSSGGAYLQGAPYPKQG